MTSRPGFDDVPVALDPTSDRPIYRQIADWLHRLIDLDVLPPGSKLPSESELMRQFNTTRTTVRRAVASLAAEGRVRTQRGVGAFVKGVVRADALVRRPYDRMARYHYGGEGRSPLYVDAQTQGLSPDAVQQDQLELKVVAAPRNVAHCLDVEPGTELFRRRRRMWMGGQPTQLTNSYIPLDIATATLRAPYTREGGTHARIEEQGFRLTEFVERLSVRMPAPYESRALHLDEGVPVVDLTQTSYAAAPEGGSRPVECFVAVIAGDRYVFEYGIDAA